jgi:hypothetical protein
MKKQINPTIRAHLIRRAFDLLLLLDVCLIPFALAQRVTIMRSVPAIGQSQVPIFPNRTTSLGQKSEVPGVPSDVFTLKFHPHRNRS